MLKERKVGACGHTLSQHNPGPLCWHCEETRWDVSVDPFEPPDKRIILYEFNRIRHESGISWNRLSELTGFPPSRIKNWGIKCRLTGCPYEEAEKIANALGVTVAELKGDR